MGKEPARRSILWVIRGDEDYGVGRATVGMAGALAKSDYRVVFASVEDGALSGHLRELGYTVTILEGAGLSPSQNPKSFWGNVARQIRHQLGLRSAIKKCADDDQCDWVHVRHNDLLPLAAMAGLARKVPIAWHIPNTINAKLAFGLQALLLQIFCKLTGIFPLANSQHTADSLGSRFVDVNILRVGIDPSFYGPDVVTESPRFSIKDLANGDPVFGIFARVVPDKAQNRVIEAIARLRKKGLSVHLLIVGGPLKSAYYEGLVHRVAELGITDCVTFVPPQDDPRPWYKIADVVVNSRLDAEPFGLTVVEAMLMQKPVLAYKLGGPSETVADGQTGWLIDSPSVEAYEDGLARALRDRALWNEMGKRGRTRALREFTTEAVACDYLRIIETIRRPPLQRRS